MRGINPTISIAYRFGCAAVGILILTAATFTVGDARAQGSAIFEEITVTAQRREQSLQEVPMSVTALSGERLESMFEGGEDIRALAARVPSLYVESSNGRLAPRFYMRGLGNTDFDLAASQSVSVIVDEVVQENVILKSFPIFDIERLEVLRGPQGTLFGRNTPAGIVKFETKRPTAEGNGYALATLGSAGTFNFEGALGGALNDSETLMGRFSILSQNRDDWIDNGFTGEDDAMGGWNELAWRAQLLWEPSDSFSGLFNVHGRELSNGTASMFRANILDTGSSKLNGNFIRDLVWFDEGDNNPQEAEAMGSSLRLDFDFGNDMTLTSITAYEGVENHSLGDIDGGFGAVFAPPFGPGFIPFNSQTQDGITDLDQLTQEFRLASQASDSIFWQAGVFYFDSDFSIETVPFFAPPTILTHTNTTWAVFGQVAWDISDATTLTAGVRYTDDEKEMTADQSNFPVSDVFVDDSQVSWDLSLNFATSDQTSTYVRLANGFRAPTIQGRDVAFFGAPSTADSETIISVEAGIKSTFANDRIRVNGAVYYYQIDDQQFTAIGGMGNSIQLINADQGVGTGIDLDSEFLITDNLSVNLGISYNRTEIEDSELRVAPCGSGLCTPTNPLDADGFALVDGNEFPNAPDLMVNFILRYSKQVDYGELFFVTDWAHQSNTDFLLYQTEEFQSGSTFEGGVRAGIIHESGNWELSVFGRNITDEENLKGIIDFNNNTGFVNDRRIWGATFRVNFGDY
jgi:iron complex outermembrane receptor protein